MPNLTINSRGRSSSILLTDCLSSLFALELMSPSQELYLISPWVSDMPLLANRFGQFRGIMPEMGKSQLGLAALLGTLAERGVQVRLICRPGNRHTDAFLRQLHELVERRLTSTLHEKGLVTNQFYLRGSMNFTYSGAHLNDEHVELTTEPDQVSQALVSARQRWKDLAP